MPLKETRRSYTLQKELFLIHAYHKKRTKKANLSSWSYIVSNGVPHQYRSSKLLCEKKTPFLPCTCNLLEKGKIKFQSINKWSEVVRFLQGKAQNNSRTNCNNCTKLETRKIDAPTLLNQLFWCRQRFLADCKVYEVVLFCLEIINRSGICLCKKNNYNSYLGKVNWVQWRTKLSLGFEVFTKHTSTLQQLPVQAEKKRYNCWLVALRLAKFW